jgi:hypothetical protein
MKCKIKVLKELEGVWARYQPEVGKVYDADFAHNRGVKAREVAVIDINGKKILLRWHEFEVVEGAHG